MNELESGSSRMTVNGISTAMACASSGVPNPRVSLVSLRPTTLDPPSIHPARARTHLFEVGQEGLHSVRDALCARVSARKHLFVELLVHLLQEALERREPPAERARVQLEVNLGDLEAGRFRLGRRRAIEESARSEREKGNKRVGEGRDAP